MGKKTLDLKDVVTAYGVQQIINLKNETKTQTYTFIMLI